MDSTTRGAVSPRAGSPARTTGSVAPGWALYRGSYASRFTHSSCVAREAESARRQRIETSGRERGREEGTRREPTGRTVPATMATSRDPRVARARPHMFRSRASRPGRRSRPRRRGICARRAADVACARRRDVVRAKRGSRARARAVARSLAVTAFLREWLIFLLHQSRRPLPRPTTSTRRCRTSKNRRDASPRDRARPITCAPPAR